MEKTEDGKQPYFVRPADLSPLFFGGLYEPARDSASSGAICASCTIITMQASNAMAPLHHRMPLMFSAGLGMESWLASGSFNEHLDTLPWHAVDKAVNNTRNQGEHVILAI